MSAQVDRDRLPVHPERVRAALDPRLNAVTIARLMACDRLRGRLDQRLGLHDRAADGGEPVSLETYAWLLANPSEAARRAGALLHGQALRAVLSGPEVARLVALIGREAHVVGLRDGALSAPREHGGNLADAIRRDGHACLGAWLRQQPEALRKRVLLSLPPGTPVESATNEDLGEQAMMVMEHVMRSYRNAESVSEHG